MDKATEWYEAELDKAYARIEALERELAEERSLCARLLVDIVNNHAGVEAVPLVDLDATGSYRNKRGG